MGLTPLLRANARRDRWIVLAWVVGVAAVFWSQASTVQSAYPTQAALDRLAASVGSNPALTAMAGPARALDTVGGFVAWKAGAFGAVMVGLMSMFLVGRHTRAEEESGRDELVRSGVVDRRAPFAAAAVVAVVANLFVGLAVAGALIGAGLDGAGSVALGVGLAASGLTFTGVSLLAAQLTTGARAMYGLVGAVVGAAWTLRAVGDVGGTWLSWTSPIGWYQGMRPFAGERWWPLLLLVGAGVGLAAAGLVVLGRRDLGAGIIAPRPGPAGSRLGGWRLAWRLQRASLAAWAAGVLALAIAYGSIGDGVDGLVDGSGVTSDIFRTGSSDVVAAFFGTGVLLLAMLAGGFAVMSALRAHGEEDAGRTELPLSTGWSRRRFVIAHAVPTVAGTLLLLLVAGLGLGVTLSVATHDASAALRYVVPALSYTTAVLALASIAWFLSGVAPRLAPLAWAGLLLSVVDELFGEVLRLPAVVRSLSPFHHLALAPAQDVRWWPVVVVGVVAVGLGAAGLAALSRRDMR